ncbi:uncharacterized protein JCM6883_006594 [Sporobolomyces salmoneus]|uniref:uncharacterized protein n=1 Tax=Sporobolomyces salmoneus TaxID=183962 RepID=UPI00316BF0C5
MEDPPFLPPAQRRVYPIPDLHPLVLSPPSLPSYSSSILTQSPSPVLCIDNGTTHIRAGYSNAPQPYLELENIGAKYKDRKLNTTVNLAGGEVYVDAASRSSTRVPYEGDVVCNFDVMENILDYVMIKLGVDTPTIQTPIVMTEALCNPSYSRSLMTEILFESYGAPSIAYGLDSLFSFYDNSPSPTTADGLVISSGSSSTQVIPVLNGQSILTSAKKLTWGGNQASEYLLKLMQLKYPAFPGRLSSYQSGIMYRDHCYNSVPDYQSSIVKLAKNPKNIVAMDRIIQFPFTSSSAADEKTEEEVQKQLEKRKEATKRLQEQAARQRLEKMERQQEEMAVFGELKASQLTLKKADYEKKLVEYGFSSTEDLDEYLNKIEKSLTRARNKELGIDETETKEVPSFPLIDVPDHTLNEQDLKEKRKQKLMKAGYDARIRMKAEKEQERLRLEQIALADQRLRETDFSGWLQRLRGEHEEIMNKMKERKKKKEQLSDRKSLAAQQRMKSIAGLAADESKGVGTGGGGSVGGPGANKRRKKGNEDDGFGKSDADWAIYREIGNADDSEDEEDEVTSLKQVEARLLEHDPNFTLDDTAERLAMRSHQLFNSFVYGLSPDDPLDTYDPSNVEHTSQLHVNVERIRVPEVLWQPHLGGLDQAGLGEVVEYVLKRFGVKERERLMSNIFVTGGNTLLPNFDSRLRSSLTPVLPVGHPLNITRTYDSQYPAWSAWRGMSKWSNSDRGRRAFVTRQEYEENGAEWFKEHGWGNRYIA